MNPTQLLDLDAEACRENFGRHPFLVRHRLAGHPLFAMPALVALARRLPAKSVEYNPGDLPRTLDPAKTPSNGLSAEETLTRIGECRSWMVLKNVERDPEYRALLERCLAEVGAHSEPVSPGMHDKEAFIFVSSPGSITPFHMDPEQNFLLQLSGRKTLHVFEPSDREVVPTEAVERFYNGGHRNLQLPEALEGRASRFELSPGVGLHMPVTAPHWVRNGDEVSISFSITFQTRASARQAHVHRTNAIIRNMGFCPAPVGASGASDTVKALVSRAKARVERTRARVARKMARMESARARERPEFTQAPGGR